MIPGPFVGINYLYQNARNMKVAQYDNYIKRFLVTPDEEILGAIFSNEQYDATTQTRNAWLSEISTLKAALQQFAQNDNAYIFFEYTIPRVDGRIDCGLIINGILFVIECKTGEGADEALGAYKEQVMQYVTDLKNFHFESYDIPIVPVLLIDNLPHSSMRLSWKDENAHLYSLVSINSDSLRPLIEKVLKETVGQSIIDPVQWLRSPYCPTANIVEAARELFNNHTVADIKRSDAKGENLVRTTERIMSLIHQARDNHEKYLCMITGVPGAGKTLIGLSVATEYKNEEKQNRSVYLSGNHPLVAVLQEALAKDAYQREKEARDAVLATIEDADERRRYKKAHPVTKTDIKSEIKQFIQMIYLWRGEYLKGIHVIGEGEKAHIIKDEEWYRGKGDTYLPYDHVAIFDEAQRTWNKEEHSKFVRQKSKMANFPEWSEARFLISCMDRHQDWAVIVCLIGEGQDINHGEAGIADWIESIEHFPQWKVYAPTFFQKEVDCSKVAKQIISDDNLHLSVNLRSIRAENVSKFVDMLLMPNAKGAAEILQKIDRYPIVLTRDLEKAKHWVKAHAHANERYGLIASSKAQRLRPLAIDVSHSQTMNVETWFLGERDNVHSSYYMEDIATEFQIQGLEIDWALVAWDGDLLYKDGDWQHRQFKTSGWNRINKPILQQYQTNAYRVLLTRARRGMVIFVPEGDLEDQTRNKDSYDNTFNYLKSIGIPTL